MSAFNIKSTVLTQRDASPKVLSEGTLAKSMVREAIGVQRNSNAGTDLNTAGTQIRLLSVPSTARLSTLEYASAALGTSAIDVAAWYPTTVPTGGGVFLADSVKGTLISSSAFLANIAGADAATAWTTAFPTVANFAIALYEQPLWQILGFSVDPEINIDMGFTVRTASAINGYVGLRARFTE